MNYERYHRQLILPNFGTEAQEKIAQAKVLVVGAGGLGCPVLQFLTVAGVGNLGIVDYDIITVSNLQRQILYDESSIGRNKAEMAKEKLQQLNSEITITAFPERFTQQNALNLLQNYDIAVGCTDNFPSRYLLDDACRLQNKPWVHGAVYQYEGQVSVFNTSESGNYRDLFPELQHSNEVLNSNETGILGVLSGIIGTIQANEVIKLITGIGEVLAGKLLIMTILDYKTKIIRYNKNEDFLPQGTQSLNAKD